MRVWELGLKAKEGEGERKEKCLGDSIFMKKSAMKLKAVTKKERNQTQPF